MSSLGQSSEPLRNGPLSIAIISPDRQRRIAATSSFAQSSSVQTREFLEYPPSLDVVPMLVQHGFDVILIDLDGDPQFALELVETICIARATIVMVFSAHADSDLMLRSMRAGAREFFTLPLQLASVTKALKWVSGHRQIVPSVKKADGRLLVFFGSKGGVGVTTLATNYAVALAEESEKNTLLIDLNLHLGDAAMNLGLDAPHSIVDALENSPRLDATLLSSFIVHHRSGLAVIAAPAHLPATKATNVAIGCLLAVARQQFDYVVVDAGKKIDLKQMHLFEEDSTCYLVTQVGIPELRNANRLILQFSAEHSPTLEIVINRHQSRFLGLTDEHLTKALTRAVQWKVPNDYAAVREMQNTSTPLVDHDSHLAAVIRQMARSVCGAGDLSSARVGRKWPRRMLPRSWRDSSQPPKLAAS